MSIFGSLMGEEASVPIVVGHLSLHWEVASSSGTTVRRYEDREFEAGRDLELVIDNRQAVTLLLRFHRLSAIDSCPTE